MRAAAGGLGMLLGCVGADAFVCESDQACEQTGVRGLCQPSGYCSFPDDACASGQRYGAHASGPLAGECVDPDAFASGTGSSDDGVTTSPLTTSTTTPGVTTTSSPTTGVDGPVTTEPVGESDTGGSTDPSTSGMGEDAPATTDPPPPAEVVCWSDEFDDGMIGAEWCPGSDPGIVIDEPRGHLRFVLLPAEWGMSGASGWTSTCEWVPLLGIEATTEVLAVPQASPYTEAYIEVGNDAVRLGMGVLNGELYAFVWDGMGYAGVSYQPYDPAAHYHLRVVGTPEGLVGESSSDGSTWVNVYTHPTNLEGSDGYVLLGTWGEMVPLAPDEASFERFALCWLEP